MRQAALVLCGLLAATLARGQATFHGDVARSGVYAAPGPATLEHVAWTFHTGGPIVASPVVADGVVYIASLDGYLYALDPTSGTERWKFKSRMPIASTPAIEGDTLYFVSSTGALAALGTADGQPRWVFAAEYEKKFEAKNLHGYLPAAQTMPDAWDLFTSSPAVAGGRVYFGSGDGGIYAVDAATGVLQWKFQTGDVVHGSPAVVDGTVYVGSWDSNLYALDAESGQPRWVFHGGQDPAIHNQVGFQSSPAVVGGTVYVGCRDAHVYAIEAKTGQKKWDYPTSKSWVIGTPAVRGDTLYVGTSDSHRFMALDTRTGRLRFNLDTKAYVFSSAALAGERVYVGSHNGRLYAIDADSGALLSEFRTEASKADPLHVLNDDGSLSGAIYAPVFGDFQDMYVAYLRFVSIGAIVSSPAIDGGTLYVGSMDGNLYAIR